MVRRSGIMSVWFRFLPGRSTSSIASALSRSVLLPKTSYSPMMTALGSGKPGGASASAQLWIGPKLIGRPDTLLPIPSGIRLTQLCEIQATIRPRFERCLDGWTKQSKTTTPIGICGSSEGVGGYRGLDLGGLISKCETNCERFFAKAHPLGILGQRFDKIYPLSNNH